MTNSSTHLAIVSIEPNTCSDNNYVIKCHFTLDLDTFYNTNQYWWFYIDTSHYNNSNLELIKILSIRRYYQLCKYKDGIEDEVTKNSGY